MRRTILLLLCASLVLAGYGLYRWLFPPDELAIRRMLNEAAEAASWDTESGAIARLAAAGAVAGYCAQDVEILLGTQGMVDGVLRGRDEVRQAAAGVRGQAASLRIELNDPEVKIEPSGTSATALLEASVRQSGATEPWVQEFRVEVVKRDGEWLIRRVQPLRGFGM